jgi:hypothetical protein
MGSPGIITASHKKSFKKTLGKFETSCSVIPITEQSAQKQQGL